MSRTSCSGRGEDFKQSFAEGIKQAKEKNYEAAIPALEEALRLAPDEKSRIHCYQSLIPAYRTLDDPEKMLGAVEYLIAYGDSETEKSLLRRTMLSFVHQRGKEKKGVLEGDNARQVRAQLRDMGLAPLSVEAVVQKAVAGAAPKSSAGTLRRISSAE